MDFYYKCSSRIESTKALQFYQQVQSTQFNLALSSWICYLCLYLIASATASTEYLLRNCSIRKLKIICTISHTLRQNQRGVTPVRSCCGHWWMCFWMQKAQRGWSFHELQSSEFWAPPAVWQPCCEGLGAHTPSCLHKWDYTCRLRASTEIWISHRPELHLCAPHSKLLWSNSPPALLFTGNLLWQWHDLISSFKLCIFIFKSV